MCWNAAKFNQSINQSIRFLHNINKSPIHVLRKYQERISKQECVVFLILDRMRNIHEDGVMNNVFDFR